MVHQLGCQFTLIAGQVNVDVTWSRDEVLVSGFFLPYYTCSSRLFIVVLLLVNHLQWHETPLFEKGVHLGKGEWLLRHRICGVGRAHVGVHSVLGQQPIASRLRINSGSVQQQLQWGGGCAGRNHWRNWSRCSCGVSAGRSTCACGGLRKLLGQWIWAKTYRVSIVWLALFPTLPSQDCVKCFWNCGPALHDGVHFEQADCGRESWLDGFSTSIEESHCKQQSWHARTCWN